MNLEILWKSNKDIPKWTTSATLDLRTMAQYGKNFRQNDTPVNCPLSDQHLDNQIVGFNNCQLIKLGKFTMVSQPISLILVDWLYAKRKPSG